MDVCETCGGELTWQHDHKPNNSGLDDGPWLPGRAPPKQPTPKLADELRAIRLHAWDTRRAMYGPKGHR